MDIHIHFVMGMNMYKFNHTKGSEKTQVQYRQWMKNYTKNFGHEKRGAVAPPS